MSHISLQAFNEIQSLLKTFTWTISIVVWVLQLSKPFVLSSSVAQTPFPFVVVKAYTSWLSPIHSDGSVNGPVLRSEGLSKCYQLPLDPSYFVITWITIVSLGRSIGTNRCEIWTRNGHLYSGDTSIAGGSQWRTAGSLFWEEPGMTALAKALNLPRNLHLRIAIIRYYELHYRDLYNCQHQPNGYSWRFFISGIGTPIVRSYGSIIKGVKRSGSGIYTVDVETGMSHLEIGNTIVYPQLKVKCQVKKKKSGDYWLHGRLYERNSGGSRIQSSIIKIM